MSYRLEAGRPFSRSDTKPYGVLDIETDGLRGPLLYWTATCECPGDHFVDGRTAASLWAWIIKYESHGHANREHIWWAHNGGEYDFVYLFESIKIDAAARAAVVTVFKSGERIIGVQVVHSKHRIDLRDSYALMPASLASLAMQLAPELPKLDIGLARGVTFDPDDDVHKAYARRDVESLLAVLQRYRAILSERFGGTLPSWTAASTALRAWQQTLGADVSYSPGYRRADSLARAGYFGGLVHLGDIRAHRDVVTIDANSMYPSVMREGGVPAGWSIPVSTFDPVRPGMYLVDVDVSHGQPFTMLPYRDPDRVMAWPTGQFTTILTSLEVKAARTYGMTVNIRSGYVWARLDHPFDAYVDLIEAMRREGGALAAVGKIMGNGLYGKFGTKPEHDEWCVSDGCPGPEWVPAADDPDDVSLWGLWKRNVTTRMPYMLPHWAAWITAGARVKLAAACNVIGAESVIYTDTDSITAPRDLIDAAAARGDLTIGSAFGQWKIETAWYSYRVFAPKVYRGVTMTGRRVRKAKGIPAALRAMAFGHPQVVVGWNSPNGALRVLKGAMMTTHRDRRLSNMDNSLGWRVLADGAVRPVHLTMEGVS